MGGKGLDLPLLDKEGGRGWLRMVIKTKFSLPTFVTKGGIGLNLSLVYRPERYRTKKPASAQIQ
jgi:hypothetical protein